MEKELLVGSTGFVGGNLMAAHTFTNVCHSVNVAGQFGSRPDLCVYAGVPSAMFLANTDPEADLAVMKQALENIKKIMPKKLVLISTIAVYKDSRGKNEQSRMEKEGLMPYGANRLLLETWVRETVPDAMVVRLPALYGVGLKKNFLYDLYTVIPFMLTEEKYKEMGEKSCLVRESYQAGKQGFYVLSETADKKRLREFFEDSDFNALSFTDSRSCYQFYSLARLWGDIKTGFKAGLRLLNLTPPPVTAAEVYETVTGKSGWKNERKGIPFAYDLHSLYAELFGGKDGYLCSKEEELRDICRFFREWKEQEAAKTGGGVYSYGGYRP